MVSRIEKAFLALEAKIDAEHEQVQEKIGSLVSEIAGLKEQVLAGLDGDAIVDRLDLLSGKVELIYVPEAVEEPAIAEEVVDVVPSEVLPVYEVEEDPDGSEPEPLDEEPSEETIIE